MHRSHESLASNWGCGSERRRLVPSGSLDHWCSIRYTCNIPPARPWFFRSFIALLNGDCALASDIPSLLL